MADQDPEDSTAVAVHHARMRWDAEVENASRLSHRENGILTVIAGILGLGLFKLGTMDPAEPAVLWFVRICLVVSILLLFVALGMVLITRSKVPERAGETPIQYASAHLRWSDRPEDHPSKLKSGREANLHAYKLLTRAATHLHRRNLVRKGGIDRSQRFLFGAALAAGLAIVCYICCPATAASAAPGTAKGDAGAQESPKK